MRRENPFTPSFGERRRGVIGFDLPFFRDYLREKKAEGSLGI